MSRVLQGEMEGPGIKVGQGVSNNERVQTKIQNLCRLCAKKNKDLIPIFKGEGIEYQLKPKIDSHLPIKVHENDALPTQMCYDCASALLAWHELVENCLQAENKLNTLITHQNKNILESIKCDDSNSFAEDISGTDAEGEDENIVPIISENKSSCNTEYIDKSTQPVKKRLRSTEQNHDLSEEIFEKTVKEEQSKTRSTASLKAYLAHVKMLRNLAKSNLTGLTTGRCTYCNHQLNQDFSLEKHVSDCEMFKSNDTSFIELHEKCNLEEHEVHDCTLFSKQAEIKGNEKGQLQCELKSKKQCIEVRIFSCEHCCKKFKYKDSYLRHVRIHLNERPYSCVDCGKEFRDSGGLARHVRDVHIRLKKHRCDFCLKWFANRMTLDDHKRTHTGERPYICDSCGNMFKSKAALYNHNKIHSPVFPHICSFCNKCFRRKQQLLDHESIHTGEKIHICDKCGKGFRVRGELHRHIVVHSDEKPFTCFECGLNFRQKRYLKNHVKSRHNRKICESSQDVDSVSLKY